MTANSTLTDGVETTIQDDPSEAVKAGAPTAKPSRLKVIEVIRSETQCTYNEALDVIFWMTVMLTRAREAKHSRGQAITYPRAHDMLSRSYELFDLMIPHDAEPAPGSAHDLLGRLLLDASLGENYICHYQAGARRHCVVGIGFDH